jgi:predicted nucleotidyltransferase
VMGSHAYGTNTSTSDWDFYGFIVPPPEYIFPNISGRLAGFGKQLQEFNQYQGQHLVNPKGVEYDVTVYNITRYFQLCMDGNPNMIDSLFTDESDLVKSDNISYIVRQNRTMFLSQKCWHTFKGMAHSHLSRLNNRIRVGKRSEIVEKYGYDVKDASHIVRLMGELKQILEEGDLFLKVNSGMVMDVKEGRWTKEEVISYFEETMTHLSLLVEKGCAVPHSPNEKSIKDILLWALEEKYGSLEKYGYYNGSYND